MRFLLLVAIFFIQQAAATTTICNVNGEVIGPTTVSWDTATGKAKVRSFSGAVYEGKVSLVRKHDKGIKVNLVFPGMGSPYQDEMEYIVFPSSDDEYRIIGVGYKLIDGRKYLDISDGNFEANCSSL